jgi:hypothetical protein
MTYKYDVMLDRLKLCYLTALLVVSGCVSQPKQNSQQGRPDLPPSPSVATRAAETSATTDTQQPPAAEVPRYQYPVTASGDSRGRTKYSGINVGTNGHTLLLRGWRTANGETLYQLYVAVNYLGTKRDYNSSVDRKGAILRFTPSAIDSKNCDGTRCQYTEHIAITLPKSYLAENRSSGLELSLNYGSGSTKVSLTPKYVTDFIAQVP